MADQRIVDVVQVIAGKLTAAQVAERHRVSTADVELWAQTYLAGLEGAVSGGRSLRRKRWPAVVVGGLVVAGLASQVSFASGSACGETLPGSLLPFCPDEPARSADINQNYRALISLFEAKLGLLSSPDVTLASGGVSATRATFAPTAFDGGSPSPVIVNDTVSQALVLVGQGTSPNRRVTVRDDLVVISDLSVNGTTALSGNTSVAGNLTVTGSLAGGNIAGTISGGGTLVCQFPVNIVISCSGLFGSGTCPAVGTPCNTGTRLTCPSGSTPRDVSRDCNNPGGGLPYLCITQSFCVRD